MWPILRESNLTSYGKFDQFPFFSYFLGGDFSLLMPQANISPKKWMDWKTILFLRLSPYLLGLFAVSSRGCIKGIFPAEAAAVCWHDPDFDLCWGHRGGVEKRWTWGFLVDLLLPKNPSSISSCWKNGKMLTYCIMYISILYILPSQQMFHLSVLAR